MHKTIKKNGAILSSILILFFLSGCGVTLKHISSQSINEINMKYAPKVMIADIGDQREGESPDRIGQGVSYWLPVSFYARDAEGKKLPVSYYIAESLNKDLSKIGFDSKLANDDNSREPLTTEDAILAAKEMGFDYLVTTKVVEGKTNFWGFFIIPFMEPVWTRISLDVQLYNLELTPEKQSTTLQTIKKETEWYFAKITILDAIFDAGLFGKHWHETAWGETVISDAVAETAHKISENIRSKN